MIYKIDLVNRFGERQIFSTSHCHTEEQIEIRKRIWDFSGCQLLSCKPAIQEMKILDDFIALENGKMTDEEFLNLHPKPINRNSVSTNPKSICQD